MSYSLYIAEKPSVGKAIAEGLGGIKEKTRTHIVTAKGVVTWCFGHLLEQAEPDAYLPRDVPTGSTGRKKWREADLPIIPQKWILHPKREAREQLAMIKKLLADASEVVHAGDPDKEGQLLVDEVLEYFHWKGKTQRILPNALDSASIAKALKAVQDNRNFAGLRDAALSRSRADWLVGMNLSRSYTLAAQKSNPGKRAGVFSVGRVQTPTLALIVARDEAIENFVAKDYFVPRAVIKHANGSFEAAWERRANDERPGIDEEGRVTDKRLADAIVAATQGQTGAIKEFSAKLKKESQPLPWALSALQVAASARYGMSAKQVLDTCQSLYETHALTSYPRTDCPYLPVSQFADRQAVLAAVASNMPSMAGALKSANLSLQTAAWDDKKVKAHHGIVPTAKKANFASLNQNEQRIYEMIVMAYVAQFHPEHVYESRQTRVEIKNETFVASSKETQSPGWRAFWWESSKNNEGEASKSLPDMKKGDPAKAEKVVLDTKQTRPPARFNEGSLINAMVNIHRFVENPEVKKRLKGVEGLGTEATRASIIETLINRDFVEKKGKQLISTPKGRLLVKSVDPEVADPGLTAMWEDVFERIQDGEVKISQFMTRQEEVIRGLVSKALLRKLVIPGLPDFGDKPQGASGKSAGTGRGRKRASTAKSTSAGKPRTGGKSSKKAQAPANQKVSHHPPAQTPSSKNGPSCPSCKTGTLQQRAGKFGPFWGCSEYRAGCKATFKDQGGKPSM